jgi:hypothetical protein
MEPRGGDKLTDEIVTASVQSIYDCALRSPVHIEEFARTALLSAAQEQ